MHTKLAFRKDGYISSIIYLTSKSRSQKQEVGLHCVVFSHIEGNLSTICCDIVFILSLY